MDNKINLDNLISMVYSSKTGLIHLVFANGVYQKDIKISFEAAVNMGFINPDAIHKNFNI